VRCVREKERDVCSWESDVYVCVCGESERVMYVCVCV